MTLHSVADISDDWWDEVLDGRLWQVDARLAPGHDPEEHYISREPLTKLRSAAIYQARRRGLRLSAMIRTEYKSEAGLYEPVIRVVPCLYLQSFLRNQVIKDDRWDRAKALLAPAFVPSTRPRGRARIEPLRAASLVDHTDTIARLLADQVGPAVTPRQLTAHRELGWYLTQCRCGTENFRTHKVTCQTYPLLGMMERVVKRQSIPPEEWYPKYGIYLPT
jgi:hypothetical protein